MKAARKDSLRWKRKVEINFDRIIALIESGVAAKFAVQQVEDGPKYFHLVRWLNEVRPDLWPLYQAAVAKSQSSVVPFTEEAFDRALEMIADIPHGLFNAWHVDGLPGVKTMRARARRDRSFKARFDEALAQRRVHVRPHTYDDKDYSAALDVIEGLEQGQPLRDADDILETLNLPGTGAIFKRVQRDRALIAPHSPDIMASIGDTLTAACSAVEETLVRVFHAQRAQFPVGGHVDLTAVTAQGIERRRVTPWSDSVGGRL